MNLRWLLFDYADLDLPLSFWKRQKLAWRPIPTRKLPKSVRRGRRVCAVGLMLPVVVFYSVVELFSSGVGLLVLLVVTAATLWIWGCLLYGLVSRPEHYHRIRLEGFDVCLKCAYWLRGLVDETTNCPECGAKREPMPDKQPQMNEDEQG